MRFQRLCCRRQVLESVALVMQHVESYDRFVRNAALELEDQGPPPPGPLAPASAAGSSGASGQGQLEAGSQAAPQRRVVLPPQTDLNEALAEVGVGGGGRRRGPA